MDTSPQPGGPRKKRKKKTQKGRKAAVVGRRDRRMIIYSRFQGGGPPYIRESRCRGYENQGERGRRAEAKLLDTVSTSEAGKDVRRLHDLLLLLLPARLRLAPGHRSETDKDVGQICEIDVLIILLYCILYIYI